MKPFSQWLEETMDESIENLDDMAQRWKRTPAEVIDHLVREWWEYTEEVSSYDKAASRLVEIEVTKDLADLREMARVLGWLAQNIEIQISPRAEAEHLRSWAETIESEDPDDARILLDAAAVLETIT